MPRLHETIDTALPIAEAFDFVADFANCESLGPRRRDVRAHRSRTGRASALATGSASARAAVSSRWSTG